VWVPRRKTADRYGVSVRTIERWEADPELHFPKSIIVNGRRYDDVGELDDWDATCAAASRSTRTPPAARQRLGPADSRGLLHKEVCPAVTDTKVVTDTSGVTNIISDAGPATEPVSRRRTMPPRSANSAVSS
jgi:hypothetical protein